MRDDPTTREGPRADQPCGGARSPEGAHEVHACGGPVSPTSGERSTDEGAGAWRHPTSVARTVAGSGAATSDAAALNTSGCEHGIEPEGSDEPQIGRAHV